MHIITTSAFYPDPGHYHSDSETTIPLEFSMSKFSKLACWGRECELERQGEGGYEADVEDEGESECLYDAGKVVGQLESSGGDAQEEEEQIGNCEGDVDMHMG